MCIKRKKRQVKQILPGWPKPINSLAKIMGCGYALHIWREIRDYRAITISAMDLHLKVCRMKKVSSEKPWHTWFLIQTRRTVPPAIGRAVRVPVCMTPILRWKFAMQPPPQMENVKHELHST